MPSLLISCFLIYFLISPSVQDPAEEIQVRTGVDEGGGRAEGLPEENEA